MSKHIAITVFPDQEGWEIVDRTNIAIITEKDFHDLCDGSSSVRDLKPILEIALKA